MRAGKPTVRFPAVIFALLAFSFTLSHVLSTVQISYSLKSKALVITGASENHAYVLEEWLEKHRFLADNCKIVVYDLGLSEVSRRRIDGKHDWFSWATFQYESYPAHVDIRRSAGCYAWKPIIIHSHMSDHDVVLWLDSGVRLTEGNDAFSKIIEHIETMGYYTTSSASNVRTWVHEGTRMALLGENDADFLDLDMCNAAVLGFKHGSPIPSEFVNCAVEVDCICPPGSSRANHRQDQAVVTLLLYLHYGTTLRFPQQSGWTLHVSKFEQAGDSVETSKTLVLY